MIKWLVLFHILTAIIGIGPTFYLHVLLRKGQNLAELKHSIKSADLLLYFPKIGGTLAVLSGILLVIVGPYSFSEFWIYGSIILYILIQVIVIGFIEPRFKKLKAEVNGEQSVEIPTGQMQLLGKINNLFNVSSTFGILLFVLMILKPLL